MGASPRGFESLFLRHKEKRRKTIRLFFLSYTESEEGFEGGSRFAGAKRFARFVCLSKDFTAKSTIDNCRAGRAAKGANPSSCAIKRKDEKQFVFSFYRIPNPKRDSRVGAVLREQNALPVLFVYQKISRQSRQLIIVERGAPLKAQIPLLALICRKERARILDGNLP